MEILSECSVVGGGGGGDLSLSLSLSLRLCMCMCVCVCVCVCVCMCVTATTCTCVQLNVGKDVKRNSLFHMLSMAMTLNRSRIKKLREAIHRLDLLDCYIVTVGCPSEALLDRCIHTLRSEGVARNSSRCSTEPIEKAIEYSKKLIYVR